MRAIIVPSIHMENVLNFVLKRHLLVTQLSGNSIVQGGGLLQINKIEENYKLNSQRSIVNYEIYFII